MSINSVGTVRRKRLPSCKLPTEKELNSDWQIQDKNKIKEMVYSHLLSFT